MSIRCSLLGHDYGDTETEREREEQGSEVVVTVREFEECQRCGERKIVSENKEVTSIESSGPDRASETNPAVDAGPVASGGRGSAASARTDANSNSGPDANAGTGTGGMGVPDEAVPAGGDDAEILGESTDSGRGATGDTSPGGRASDAETATETDAPSSSESPSPPPAESSSAAGDDFEESPADDDAEILDADATDEGDESTPREWPEAETTHPAEADERGPGDWPNVERDDEGFDAEPDDGEAADVEFGGGLTPESSADVTVDDDETDEVEFVNASGDTLGTGDGGRSDAGGRDTGGSAAELSSGISAGAEAPSVSGPSDDPDLDAEFVCPECDYREAVTGSSLRAGDICPECGRGYLAQE